MPVGLIVISTSQHYDVVDVNLLIALAWPSHIQHRSSELVCQLRWHSALGTHYSALKKIWGAISCAPDDEEL